MTDCNWPGGACACYMAEQDKVDHRGRVWMHCDKGLSMTKASMSRFVMFCLENSIEIGDIYPFDPRHKGCQVSVSVRIRPEQFDAFTDATKGILRRPTKLNLN